VRARLHSSCLARCSGVLALRAPSDVGGIRLDRFLAELDEIGSRSAAERHVAAGRVTVDGLVAGKALRLRGGEQIEIELEDPGPGLEPVELGLDVVFEDDHLLIVDKPAGLVTHPATGLREPTLVHGLLARGLAGGTDPERPGVVHRLDRDTTGLLVLARDETAHAALSDMLRARAIEREYVTLVHGRPPSRRGTIDAPIGRDPRTPGRMAVDGRAPRHAVTHFELAEALARTSLLEVRLETGRTHQIRVHLSAIGHPVVGDRVYGRGGNELGLTRQFLHAARLAFVHPITGARIELYSPLPDDLAAALEIARAE
jgi:23S rRNA pseudouridine1911/1915/1917 synthase